MRMKIKQAIENLAVRGNSEQYIYINKNFTINLTLNIKGTLNALITLDEYHIEYNHQLGWGIDEKSNFEEKTNAAIHILKESIEGVIYNSSKALNVVQGW